MQFKHDTWILKRWEDKVLRHGLVPKLPRWLETHHLTLLTIPEAFLSLLGGYLAQFDIQWLWLVNLGVISHYITDTLDGELGRFRNTGLIKWGFYMDHILDFLFLGCLLTGYSFIIPSHFQWVLLLTLVVFGMHFTNNILYFGATGKFEIAMFGFGPSEMRWIFVVANTMLITAGKIYFVSALPWILGITFLSIVIAIYRNHHRLWQEDMQTKHQT